MEIPGYQPFYIDSLAALRAEIVRLGLEIPTDDEPAPLAQPLPIGARKVPNRFCAQPIAGRDARPDGAPGELTRRRYRRYAEGRFGLIWIERTAAGPIGKPKQLCLHEGTLAPFREMVAELRAAAVDDPTIVIQLASEQPSALIHAATLTAQVGFDGVDFQCHHDDLAAVLAAVRERAPGLLLATRLCAYEAVRDGFGVSAGDYRKPDLAEPVRLVQQWRENGLALLNVTTASPRLRGPERGVRAYRDSESADEHPLMTLARQLSVARILREAAPDLPVVGSGFAWLRQFVPNVAGGALRGGMIDFAGLGRGALAHPAAPAETFAHGRMEGGSTCMVCFACSQLRENGVPVGCVQRDPAVYGSVYRQMRRFDDDRLMAGAARCHLCEAAPCVAASPTRSDIPAFIDAFRKGDEARAYEIIRESDPLPELTARLSPAWMESEGACIETTLTGTPVPILDLQFAIAWRARDRGETGALLPTTMTGKTVAIVGGGPTGIAAAIRLVELGHHVDLYEQAGRLGGVPGRLLSATRQLDPQEEISAALQPAITAGRLHLHLGVALGKDLELGALRASHDAVLLAVGLWQERSLGKGRGVMGALPFLETTDHAVPERVAILAGGDAAMDAARAAQSRGAKEIFVIFGGPRSALHWHMPESWFATPGVHAMMNWEPLGYEIDRDGALSAVRLRHTELHAESALSVALVIEAMGLEVADHIRDALACENGRIYMAGAMVNGGASVSRCVAEGLAAAEAIHRDLSP